MRRRSVDSGLGAAQSFLGRDGALVEARRRGVHLSPRHSEILYLLSLMPGGDGRRAASGDQSAATPAFAPALNLAIWAAKRSASWKSIPCAAPA